jgi:hypothetical protein
MFVVKLSLSWITLLPSIVLQDCDVRLPFWCAVFIQNGGPNLTWARPKARGPCSGLRIEHGFMGPSNFKTLSGEKIIFLFATQKHNVLQYIIRHHAACRPIVLCLFKYLTTVN